MSISQSELDNRPRWNWKDRGFYEVWFFKFNIPDENLAFWFRYTLLAPSGDKPILAELWAIAFGVGQNQSHIALKQTFPISAYKSDPKNFVIRIADSVLRQDKAMGKIEQAGKQISWNLNYIPNQETYHHAPPLLRVAPIPKTKVCTPHMNILYNGEITLNGKTYSFQNAPGMQGHIWGTQHAHSWVWGHCNTFKEKPDTILEALSGRVMVGPKLSPPLSPMYIKYEGKDYFFNKYHHLFVNKSDFKPGYWKFEVTQKDVRFIGELTASIEKDAVGVEYTDPDHTRRYCYNTKIGQAKLTVLRYKNKDWKIEETLHAENSCATEWVFSEPLQDIPIMI